MPLVNFGNLPESKNFTDHTGWLYKWITQNFNKMLTQTGVAIPDTDAKNPSTAYPLIKPVNPDYNGPLSGSWSDFDITPDEETLLKRGMTSRDLLLLRAYKNTPSLVGK